MKVIVFAATKGGTGKSTLCFNLGIEAVKHGSVFFADMDPQKSLKDLCERRGKQNDLLGHQPMLLTDVGSIPEAVRHIHGTQYARDFLIVDTPGSHMSIIRNAIQSADCVVLPCQPSILDILAQEDIAPLVDKLGKADRTLFVINRVDGRVNVDGTLDQIAAMFANKPVRIKQRQGYVKGAEAGKAGFEVGTAKERQDCAAEMAALWQAISNIIQDTNNAQAQYEKPHANIAS
jgi:chromosome partitioning protein